MAVNDGLIAYWKMNETSGNRADSFGGHTLTDTNTVTSTTGILDNGASFSSANSEYFVASTLDMATEVATGDFTISLWFNVANADARRTLLAISNAADFNDFFAIRAGNTADGNTIQAISRDGTTGQGTLSASGFQDGSTYHLVVTRTGTSCNLIINNVSRDSATNAEFGVSLKSTFQIGRFVNTDYMNGMIDEVGVWNRVLDSGEITQLYNSGSAFAYPFDRRVFN